MAFMQFRRKRRRTPVLAAIAGIAVGSTVAYLLRTGRRDTPEKRRRREQLRAAIDRSPLIEELSPAPEEIDDDLLLELVRSELRRCCSYPASIDVSCRAGVVRLEGPVLKSELNRVLRSVARIPGVEEIHDHLAAHRHPWGFNTQALSDGAPITGSLEVAP